MLFTTSNSLPIFFGKDSLLSLINVVFISVNEHCAKYSRNQLKFQERQWILISNLKIESAPSVSLGFFYVPSHGTLISQYLQTYRTIFYLPDLEVPELSST